MNTTETLKKILETAPTNDMEKLKKQQKYYKRLTQNGTAQKQTYNLKPVSAI